MLLLRNLNYQIPFFQIFVAYFQNSLKRNQKNFLQIFDWLMEASQILDLPKDAFYLAVVLVRKIITQSFLKNMSQTVLQSYVASILSLAAKIQSNSMNFPDAIQKITEGRIEKSRIIQCQLSIMKKIKFQIPLNVMIYEQIVATCNKWHDFVLSRERQPSEDLKLLHLGSSSNVLDWPSSSQLLFQELCYIFDVIVLHYEEFIDKIASSTIFALFIVFNAHTQEFFPLNYADKNPLICIFHDFLASVFRYQQEGIKRWMMKLIKIRFSLNIVENVHKFCRIQGLQEKGKQNQEQQKRQFQQAYRSILVWT